MSIPKHAFLLWMVLKNKLKTHDGLKPWDVGGATNLNLVCCSLCKTGQDSHAHIFFRCTYSATVWSLVKDMAGLGHVLNIEDTTDYLIPISKGKSTKSVIGRLVLATTVYFLWQERNNRMFTNNMRPPKRLKEHIVNTVRMRLASIKFKASSKVLQLLENWKLPKSLLMDGDDPSFVR
uniref:uncharacterized protein LOC122584450 n=1 Tax=Erigeron canadensis TaxID=72917 RepID=UPI001CB89750|nr:uncharacterized protein LOC122584450 [Erigeron canadensis]